MNRHPLRHGLAWGVAGSVLLPVVLAVLLGTASLLAALGDAGAAAVCRWAALPVGVAWVVAVVATAVLAGAAVLSVGPPRGRERRRRGRRRPPSEGRTGSA